MWFNAGVMFVLLVFAIVIASERAQFLVTQWLIRLVAILVLGLLAATALWFFRVDWLPARLAGWLDSLGRTNGLSLRESVVALGVAVGFGGALLLSLLRGLRDQAAAAHELGFIRRLQTRLTSDGAAPRTGPRRPADVAELMRKYFQSRR